MTNDFICVKFSIGVTRDRVVTPVRQRPVPEPRLISICNPPTVELAPADWSPTPIFNEWFDAVERLLHDQPFTFDFDLADARVTIRITRPILIEEASNFCGI